MHRAATPTTRFAVSIYRDLLVCVFVILQFVPLFVALITGRMGAYFGPTNLQAINDASSSIVWQAIALVMFFNSLLLARLYKISVRTLLFAMLPLLPMLFWIFLSVLWSDYPDLTIRRAVRAFVEITTMVLLAVSFVDPRQLLRTLFKGFFIINLLDLSSLAVPALSFTEIGFAGVHLHKNLAGQFFFLALPIFGFGTIYRNISYFRSAAIFALVSASGMLILTLSKTAIGVLTLSAILVVLARIMTKRNVFSRIVLPAICTLTALSVLIVVLDFGIRDTFDLLFGNATLTGRDRIWGYVLYMFQRNPLHGVGYGALWQVGPDVQEMLKYVGAWITGEGHNGYLDILAQLGYVGEILLGIFLLVTLRRIFTYAQLYEQGRIIGFKDYAIYVCLGALCYNITESSFFRSGHGLWDMLVVVSGCVAGVLFRGRADMYDSRRTRVRAIETRFGL